MKQLTVLDKGFLLSESREVPQAQRIIDSMENALVELEEAAGLARPPKTAAAAKN